MESGTPKTIKDGRFFKLGALEGHLELAGVISEEDYQSKWVAKDKIAKKGILEPKGNKIEESDEVASKKLKKEKKVARSRSRSQDKKKKSKKSKKDKKGEKSSSGNPAHDAERENIKKWLLSSSHMTPED